MDHAKKNTKKLLRKHRTPSEKEKKKNAKSVPTSIRFSPIRSKKSQPKGDFFSYTGTFCAHLPSTVLCAALWQASFLRRMYRTISKTPNFMLKYELRAYAYGTYDHLPCAKAKKKVLVPRRIVR